MWFQNRRMKDKRQKMTLTWPCGDPVLAAYVLQQAAAATGMQLGPAGPSPGGYPGGLFAAAAAAAAAAAVSSSPFGPMMAPRPPGLPPPPHHPFVSPISSSSNMPHRPTPNLLAPHLHTPQPPSHPHYLPSGGGLSPRSPPSERGGLVGSAFSPATPPASCDSSSNANLGQISPQTTTKIDLPRVTAMKKESNTELTVGEERRKSIESRREHLKDIKESYELGESEESKLSHNSFKVVDRMKRKRKSSSSSSSSVSPSNSLPQTDANSSSNEDKLPRSIGSFSADKTTSPSSLEILDGIYMVKSQEHNKNSISKKHPEDPANGKECNDQELLFTKNDIAKKDTDNVSNAKRKSDMCYNDDRGTRDSGRISPSLTNVPSSTSATSASLFQPYLDIEKK